MSLSQSQLLRWVCCDVIGCRNTDPAHWVTRLLISDFSIRPVNCVALCIVSVDCTLKSCSIDIHVCMYVSCVLCWLCLCWQRFYVTNPIHYLVRTRTVCVWSQALVTPAVVSEHTLVDFLYDRSSCFVLLSVVVVFSSVTWLIEKVECFFALIEKLAGKIIYEMAGIVSYRML